MRKKKTVAANENTNSENPNSIGSTNYYDNIEPGGYIPIPVSLSPDYDEEILENLVTQPVSGNGMALAGINDGDILMIVKALPPVDGDIVNATVNGELVCRRFFIQDGKAHFRREDGRSPDIITDDYTIHGVVVEIIKKVHRFTSQPYDPNLRTMIVTHLGTVN